MFKLFYKIVYANKRTIVTYSIVFLTIFILFTTFSGNMSSEASVYKQQKVDIAIVNNDQSELSKELVKQLKKNNNVNDDFQSTDDMKDALFFATINAIVVIPKHFQQDFEAGKTQTIQMQLRPYDASGVLIKQKLNTFLDAVKNYRAIEQDLSYQEAAALVSQDLDEKAEITFLKEENTQDEDMMRNLYYNFLSYVLFSVIVMTLGTAMHSIYHSEMLKRVLISPVNSSAMNMRLVFANVSFGAGLWAFFTLVILVTHGDNMMNGTGLLSIINSLIFALLCICFAFLAMAIVSNKKNARNKLNMITNIFGLCGAFLGGAFLPQRFIPSNILMISKFLPNYWYIKLNDSIAALTDITSDTMQLAFQSFAIQLLFAVAFLALGLVIMKNKRSQDVIIDSDHE